MAIKPLSLAITAGKYKGKKLLLPSMESTRSTKSILKGSFFDAFQHDIIDQTFIEVFGGSGSMGLEALSRGAKHAYFIEKNTQAFKILEHNCNGIDSQSTTCYNGDAFVLLPTLFSILTCKAFFYCDPPFSIREGMEDVYEKTLRLIASIPSSLVICIAVEHMSELTLPEMIGVYTLQKTKKFGKSSLSYYM